MAAKPRSLPWWRRRRPLRMVFGVLLLIGVGIIIYPYLPLLLYRIAPPDPLDLPYVSRLSGFPDQAESAPDGDGSGLADADKPTPVGNRLVIPKIGVNIPVVEGANEQALLNGAWRIPATSTTPEAGNMVLSAHRFRYRPPASATFYLLDKVAAGDSVLLYWNGGEYAYRVTETRIVNPDAVEILNPTSDPRLTLFTCTPLFSTSKRLVVFAEPTLSTD